MKIALFGKIRSGKDTVGKVLTDDYGFTRYAFGDAIGEVIKDYFPDAFAGGKPRKHYQVIGQSFRQLDEDVWVKKVINDIESAGHERIIITDGRQVNEAEKMRDAGFLIVKVICDEKIRIKRMMDSGDVFNEESLTHETELQVDKVVPDVVIINEGSLMELYLKVANLLKDLEGGSYEKCY